MAEAVRLRLDPATPVKPAGPARVFPSRVNLIPLQGLVNAARGKAEDDCGIFLTRYSLGKGAHSAITRMTITGTRGTPDT